MRKTLSRVIICLLISVLFQLCNYQNTDRSFVQNGIGTFPKSFCENVNKIKDIPAARAYLSDSITKLKRLYREMQVKEIVSYDTGNLMREITGTVNWIVVLLELYPIIWTEFVL